MMSLLLKWRVISLCLNLFLLLLLFDKVLILIAFCLNLKLSYFTWWTLAHALLLLVSRIWLLLGLARLFLLFAYISLFLLPFIVTISTSLSVFG
jgi:hypothetical protein